MKRSIIMNQLNIGASKTASSSFKTEDSTATKGVNTGLQ